MKTSASAPRKRSPEDITTLSEPTLSEAQRAQFLDGIAKFNREAYWDAHEAWEQTWQAMNEDAEIFLRGLVQLAAALHCLKTQRLECAARNFEKAIQNLLLLLLNSWALMWKRFVRSFALIKLRRIQACAAKSSMLHLQKFDRDLNNDDSLQFSCDFNLCAHLCRSDAAEQPHQRL